MWIKLEDLFYALMLPSGNDAALALSELFGTILIIKNKNL
jgi:D-alanyl-D-alanine carboxypeptidase